jgi:hypothetical protein
MATVRVTSTAGLDLAQERIDQVAVAGLAKAGDAAHEEITRRMTDDRDSRGFQGRSSTGGTIQATYAKPVEKRTGGYSQRTTVRPPSDTVGAIIELGRRKGKNVSRIGTRKIRRWAIRKFGPVKAKNKSGKFKRGGQFRAEKARAYLIARAITKRGIPKLAPFANTAKTMRDGKAARIIADVARRLNGGAS